MRNFVAEFRRRLDVELCFESENLKSLLFSQKLSSKTYITKFQYECSFHDLENKKSSTPFEFYKMGVFTGI